MEQKKPYIFEAFVSGGDIKKQFDHVKELLGKEIKVDQIFETGASVDVAAITKGKGWQGVIQGLEQKETAQVKKTVKQDHGTNISAECHVHSTKSRTDGISSESRV